LQPLGNGRAVRLQVMSRFTTVYRTAQPAIWRSCSLSSATFAKEHDYTIDALGVLIGSCMQTSPATGTEVLRIEEYIMPEQMESIEHLY
jgi:hypothetical protein